MSAAVTAPATVALWRCEECGKWSTAKRRPRSHRRIVKIADGEFVPVVEERVCGPFRTYTARRTADLGPALPEHGQRTDREFAPSIDPMDEVMPW